MQITHPIQIVEKMPEAKFDDVCDAGVELFRALVAVLNRRGLGLEHAVSVLTVASAGVVAGLEIEMPDLRAGANSMSQMWRTEIRPEGPGLVFDPAHRRPDHVPSAIDPTSGN
jgi:hypothetical protein